MDVWESLGAVGEGTYGKVLKARHKETGQIVAIKKFKQTDDDEQVRKTALREIRILRSLKHDNIVGLHDVFRKKGTLYLVFEWVDGTVLDILEKLGYGLPEADVRRTTFQTMRAIRYLHQQNIMHRDIKPENILITKHGAVKLCDFGFARALAGPGAKYTDYVSTRWYRSPELLTGDVEYQPAVDAWALGCVVAELATGQPLFPGESDLDQLHCIVNMLGDVVPRHASVFSSNALFVGIPLPKAPPPSQRESLEARFSHLNVPYRNWLMKLLSMTLVMDPTRRATFDDLLNCGLFEGAPHFVEREKELQEALRKDTEFLSGLSRRFVERKQKSQQIPPPAGSRGSSRSGYPSIFNKGAGGTSSGAVTQADPSSAHVQPHAPPPAHLPLNLDRFGIVDPPQHNRPVQNDVNQMPLLSQPMQHTQTNYHSAQEPAHPYVPDRREPIHLPPARSPVPPGFYESHHPPPQHQLPPQPSQQQPPSLHRYNEPRRDPTDQLTASNGWRARTEAQLDALTAMQSSYPTHSLHTLQQNTHLRGSLAPMVGSRAPVVGEPDGQSIPQTLSGGVTPFSYTSSNLLHGSVGSIAHGRQPAVTSCPLEPSIQQVPPPPPGSRGAALAAVQNLTTPLRSNELPSFSSSAYNRPSATAEAAWSLRMEASSSGNFSRGYLPSLEEASYGH